MKLYVEMRTLWGRGGDSNDGGRYLFKWSKDEIHRRSRVVASDLFRTLDETAGIHNDRGETEAQSERRSGPGEAAHLGSVYNAHIRVEVGYSASTRL